VEPVEGVWLVDIDANVYIPGGTGPNDFASFLQELSGHVYLILIPLT
jgi:hypothetical protein